MLKKAFMLSVFSLALIVLHGCAGYTMSGPVGPGVRVRTNFPAYSTWVAVLNASPLIVTLSSAGQHQKAVQPGELVRLNFFALSGNGRFTVSAVATSTDGKFVGTTCRSFYTSGYEPQTVEWHLGIDDFSPRGKTCG